MLLWFGSAPDPVGPRDFVGALALVADTVKSKNGAVT